MPDQRSAMKEYRLLDQKRLSEGLSPDEEARFARLRDLVAADAAPAGGGFDVNAAAARLRESLLPAGLRNRPPPEPAATEPVEPEPPAAAAQDVDGGVLAAAWQDAPFAPMEAGAAPADPYFDPASLGGEGAEVAAGAEAAFAAGAEQAWDPNAQPYDPNAAGYDPGVQAYDPDAAAAYDPNAAQAWDPNAQPYDPSAAAAYDPNAAQAWDPNGQPYDPNAAAAFDPNAEQGWDPNAQPYDPNAAQAYDPNAAQAWDPNAQPYDPNAAQAYDPNAQPYDPNAAQAWDPNAQPYDPNAAQAWDAGTQAYGAPAEGDAAGFDPSSAPLDAGAIAGGQGWDANAAWEPGAAAGEPGLGPDALAGALDAGHDPSAEPAPSLDASALPPLSLGAYDDPDAVPLAPEAAEADFGLSSELPFDPAAEAAVHAGDLAEPPPGDGPPLGAYDDLSAFERAPTPPADLPADGPGFHAAAAVGEEAAAWQPDAALEAGFQLESAGSFDGLSADGAAEPIELGEPQDVTELSDADLAEVVEQEPAPAAAEEDLYAAAPASEAAPDEAAPQAPELTPETLSVETGAAPEPAPEVAAFEAAPPATAEVPTIDGEEILEELPPEEVAPPPALDFEPLAAAPEPPPPEPPPPPPPPAAPAAQVHGVHRVVVHTLEGQVKRGVLESPDLAAAVLGLAAQPGAAPEVIGTDKVKAIFFMLAPGEKAPAPEGHRVRVTFRDGRQVAGFSPDYREDSVGFFMVPADTRTNTGRIWVYRSAVRAVSVS